MDEGLQVIEDRDEGRIRLSVRGSLDIATVPDLCARLERLRASGPAYAVLDLSDLDFCDSVGLRALLMAVREAQIERWKLQVVAPIGGPARRLFEVTGVEEFFDMQPSAAAS
jgi:anti-sigma B factor antagonist